MFENGVIPSTNGLVLADIVTGCWKKEFSSAMDILCREDFEGY
jgi:hypothetical protein